MRKKEIKNTIAGELTEFINILFYSRIKIEIKFIPRTYSNFAPTYMKFSWAKNHFAKWLAMYTVAWDLYHNLL